MSSIEPAETTSVPPRPTATDQPGRVDMTGWGLLAVPAVICAVAILWAFFL